MYNSTYEGRIVSDDEHCLTWKNFWICSKLNFSHIFHLKTSPSPLIWIRCYCGWFSEWCAGVYQCEVHMPTTATYMGGCFFWKHAAITQCVRVQIHQCMCHKVCHKVCHECVKCGQRVIDLREVKHQPPPLCVSSSYVFERCRWLKSRSRSRCLCTSHHGCRRIPRDNHEKIIEVLFLRFDVHRIRIR